VGTAHAFEPWVTQGEREKPMANYKVWVQIEVQPEIKDPYNVDEPVDIIEVDTLPKARRIVNQIIDLFTDEETIAHWKRTKIYPFERSKNV
jgi:hypothetical protein